MNTIINKRPIFSPFWLSFTMSAMNLFVMHYYILCTASMDDESNFTRFVDNILGVSIDLTVITLAAYFICYKKLKATATVTFFITLLWSLSNVIYSRFFHHYISISAMAQGGSLFDSFMLDCLKSSFQWPDCYFLLVMLVFLFLTKNFKFQIRRPVSKLFILLLFCIMADILGYVIYCSLSPERRYIRFLADRIEARHFSNSLQLCNPNVSSFRRGSIRALSTEMTMNLKGPIELNRTQRAEIDSLIHQQQTIHNQSRELITPRNVIFIIIESYMSFVSDMKIDGKDVTPFLNRLKRDSCTFYNGEMLKNVTIGESSDGQFIYMTGLLPLRSVVTISQARKNSLPPSLTQQLGYSSRMLIPTVETMWRQDEMCRQYGFDSLYTSKDYGHGYNSILTDEQIFQLAMQKDSTSQHPFFSVILTMSMHQPYTEQIDPTFPISTKTMREDLASYLNKCHYTDKQIELYFNHLHKTGLFDNSLIILAADHPVLSTDFGGVSDAIPFYLVYSQGLPSGLWHGPCHQVDIYATLVDLLCDKSSWYGMGRSLLRTSHMPKITESDWNLSEQIIMGDYFQPSNRY